MLYSTSLLCSGETYSMYCPMTSAKMVLSASCRLTCTPRSVSDSTARAQRSASALLSKVRTSAGNPFCETRACHAFPPTSY